MAELVDIFEAFGEQGLSGCDLVAEARRAMPTGLLGISTSRIQAACPTWVDGLGSHTNLAQLLPLCHTSFH